MFQENELAKIVVDAALRVHMTLGPGLFESVYEEVLCYELTEKRNLHLQRQPAIPVTYEGITMELGFRADLIVENKVLIELKSVEAIIKVHQKQMLTYLRLTRLKLGLLLNFNEALLKDGIQRIVNGL